MKSIYCLVALLLLTGISGNAITSPAEWPGGFISVLVQNPVESSTGGESRKNQSPSAKGGTDKGADSDAAESSGLEHPTPNHANLEIVKSVEFTVRDCNNGPIGAASVKVSQGTGGILAKPITDTKGIARLKDLPAATLNVQVTAPGFNSYTNTVDLRTGKTKFPITLTPRQGQCRD